MRVLAIETSCDESAVCLLEAEGDFGGPPEHAFKFTVRGDALASQAALHAQYGGVFPNVAKREHAKALVPLLETVLKESSELKVADMIYHINESALLREPELLLRLKEFFSTYGKPDIDCIAVTHGPGLEPALWVGINFARALALAWSVPLVAVNHMEGHVIMPMIEFETESSGRMLNVEFPLLALLISGGHTELVLSQKFGEYERIGETRDDAAGEAFDKVARLLGQTYPGGPEISRLAAEARERGVAADFKFTRPMLHSGDYDFSFSGLKTEVRKLVEAHGELTEEFVMQVAKEFEECVADVLITKSLRAVEEYGVATLLVGGGVSANTYIRSALAERLEKVGCTLLVPSPELATDNALMIALAGYFHALKKEYAVLGSLRAIGNLRLEHTA